MGKKQKKRSIKAWKKSETAKEYEQVMEQVRESETLANKDDSAIFFEDKTGNE